MELLEYQKLNEYAEERRKSGDHENAARYAHAAQLARLADAEYEISRELKRANKLGIYDRELAHACAMQI